MQESNGSLVIWGLGLGVGYLLIVSRCSSPSAPPASPAVPAPPLLF